MTTTLSLADLAAAVVRLGAHRINLHVYGEGNPDPIARVYDHPAIITLLAAANRLPGVVEELADRDAQLAATKGIAGFAERRATYAEAETSTECDRRRVAIADRDRCRELLTKVEAERDAAIARAEATEAHLAKQAPVIEAARRQQVCRSNADNYSARGAWASATLDTERAVTDLFINALETP